MESNQTTQFILLLIRVLIVGIIIIVPFLILGLVLYVFGAIKPYDKLIKFAESLTFENE